MKIAVFGADGRTGRELVKQGMERNHEIVAFDRDFEDFEFDTEKVEGDALDYNDVEEAIDSCDAVLSGLASYEGGNIVSNATKTILKAMDEHDIDRYVVLTGAGAKLETERERIDGKMMNTLLKLLQPGILEDGKRMVRNIQNSDLDWTVVRAPRLTMGPMEGYELGDFQLGFIESVSRADVAAAMLDVAENDEFIQEMPMIK
ncbi:MAG: NmrA family protein [Nanohaloarchaea archaeon QH_8_44_6]|nr:MAG: NmrA family protein [Nanohaloarchaea archaeon QH_8_44_6]